MMMAVKSSGKDRCPEWPIIPEQDESPKFGYMLERKVGKKIRNPALFWLQVREENRKIYKECCYILATCSRRMK